MVEFELVAGETFSIPKSLPYFRVDWFPVWPNILRPYDSKRMIKKKMKRWPQVEKRTPYYVWFTVDRSGEQWVNLANNKINS